MVLQNLHFITAHSSFISLSLMDSDAISLIVGIGSHVNNMVQWYEYYSDAKLSHGFRSHTDLHCTLMNGLIICASQFQGS